MDFFQNYSSNWTTAFFLNVTVIGYLFRSKLRSWADEQNVCSQPSWHCFSFMSCWWTVTLSTNKARRQINFKMNHSIIEPWGVLFLTFFFLSQGKSELQGYNQEPKLSFLLVLQCHGMLISCSLNWYFLFHLRKALCITKACLTIFIEWAIITFLE